MDWIVPSWIVPPCIQALVTTRFGGVSEGAYASMNLGLHVGDTAQAVVANRRLLQTVVGRDVVYLDQVHGNRVINFDAVSDTAQTLVADAAVSAQSNLATAVMVADCLPILLATRDGSKVGIGHGGWRGMAAGIVEKLLREMNVSTTSVSAWLGPAIGPRHYVVGNEVREAFAAVDAALLRCFAANGEGKWRADLYAIARQRLRREGVVNIYGGAFCTFSENRFYSYRRDGTTGRMAAVIWRTE